MPHVLTLLIQPDWTRSEVKPQTLRVEAGASIRSLLPESMREAATLRDMVHGSVAKPEEDLEVFQGMGPVLAVVIPQGFELLLNVVAAVAAQIVVGYLFAPEKPTVPFQEESDPQYGWSGVQTAYRSEGVAVPVVFGDLFVGGLVVERSIQVLDTGAGGQQVKLTLVLILGLGPMQKVLGRLPGTIDGSFTDYGPNVLRIDGLPANNFQGLVDGQVGTPTQLNPSLSFNASSLQSVNLEMNGGLPELLWDRAVSVLLEQPAEAVTFLLFFPEGLYWTDGNGQPIPANYSAAFRWRKVDALGSPLSGWVTRLESIPKAETSPNYAQFTYNLFGPEGNIDPAVGQSATIPNNGHLSSTGSTLLTLSGGDFWEPSKVVLEGSWGGWVKLPADVESNNRGWFGGWFQGTYTSPALHQINLGSSGSRGFAIRLWRTAFGQISARAYLADGTNTDPSGNFVLQLGAGAAISAAQLTTNAWNHVAVTWQKLPGSPQYIARLYVNGALAEERTTNVGVRLPATAATTAVRLGIVDGLIFNPNWTSLEFDDVFIADRPLSSAEIVAIYNNGAPSSFPVSSGIPALWTFDGNSLTSTLGAGALTLQAGGAGSGSVGFGTGVVLTAGVAADPDLALYEVQATKVSGNDTGQGKNKTLLESVTGIVYEAYSYPGQAYLALQILADESLSGSEPGILARVQGPLLPICDASGTWDYKSTRNPAGAAAFWVTNKRAGFRKPLTLSDLDAASWSAWAAFCDELVRDYQGQAEVVGVEALLLAGVQRLRARFNAQPPQHWVKGKRVGAVAAGTLPGGLDASWAIVLGAWLGSKLEIVDGPYQEASGTAQWVVDFRWSQLTSGSFANALAAGPEDLTAGGSGGYKIAGYEARCEIDTAIGGRPSNAWQRLIEICQAGRATPYFIGKRLFVTWARAREPVMVVNGDLYDAASLEFTRAGAGSLYSSAYAEFVDRDSGDRKPVQVTLEGAAPTLRKLSLRLDHIGRRSQALRDLYLRLKDQWLRRSVCQFTGGAGLVALGPGDVFVLEAEELTAAWGGRVTNADPVGSLTLDRAVTVEFGSRLAVHSVAFDRPAFADVSTTGAVASGATISFGALTFADGTVYSPQPGDLWVLGANSKAGHLYECTSIEWDPRAWTCKVEAREYVAEVYAEPAFSEIEPDDPAVLPAIPVTVQDATTYGDSETNLLPAIAVTWPGQTAALGRCAVIVIRWGGEQLVQDFPSSAGYALIELPPRAAWKSVSVEVAIPGREHLTRRVLLTGQAAVPADLPLIEALPVPGGLEVSIDGGNARRPVELRLGSGWLCARRLTVLPAGAPGVVLGAVDVQADQAGLRPRLQARYVLGRGQVGPARSLELPDYAAAAGLGTSLAAGDGATSWASGTLTDLVVATVDGEQVLQFAGVAESGIWQSPAIDLGSVQMIEASVHVDVIQEHPLGSTVPLGAETKRGQHWAGIEGPTDPSDPAWGLVGVRVQVRTGAGASPDSAWAAWSPGALRCRSWQMRVALTRPSLGATQYQCRVRQAAWRLRAASHRNQLPTALDVAHSQALLGTSTVAGAIDALAIRSNLGSQMANYTSASAVGIAGSLVVLTDWTTDRQDSGFSRSAGEVTLTDAGEYEISMHVSFSLSAGTNSSFLAILQSDSGTGGASWGAITAGRTAAGVFGTTHRGTAAASWRRTVVAGERLRVGVQRLAGTGTGTVQADGTTLMVRRLNPGL